MSNLILILSFDATLVINLIIPPWGQQTLIQSLLPQGQQNQD